MNTPACPTRDQLVAYVAGRLSGQAKGRIVDHLESCRACRTVVRDLGPGRTGPADQKANKSLRQVGQYQFLEKLGEGGMGVVYKARHVKLDKTVAIKVLPSVSRAAPDAVKRFEREMQAVGRLDHPHIVRASDAGEATGIHFLVMEYLDGRDLKQWIVRNAPLPVDWCCECIRQAALGLQHAFERGLVHRDIKPSNLMVSAASTSDSPQVKILDMGLAFLSASEAGHDLTRTNQIMGTVDYIAPEQARRTKDADIRSDIFSLGCTLFHALTSRVPYEGDSLAEKLAARLSEDVPGVRRFRAEIPAALEQVIGRMLARDPKRRYQIPGEVAQALAPFAMNAGEASAGSKPDSGSCGAMVGTRADASRRPPAVRRDRFNAQLADFYKALTLGEGDVKACDSCGILIPNRRLSLSVGSHLLTTLQNRTLQFAAFGLRMKELLGEEYVTIPSQPAGMIVFLDQFASHPCAGCSRVLCPACLCGTAESPGCIVCGQVNVRPATDFNVGSLESVVDRIHSATILAALPKLASASDQEFKMIQQVVLGSARKMHQDAQQGLDIQYVGLALQKFCDAVESCGHRAIEPAAIQQIRDLCRQSLPSQMDFAVLAEFRRCVDQYIKY